ncbi:hypothetical protein D3C76_1312470 [compost metagenome]
MLPSGYGAARARRRPRLPNRWHLAVVASGRAATATPGNWCPGLPGTAASSRAGSTPWVARRLARGERCALAAPSSAWWERVDCRTQRSLSAPTRCRGPGPPSVNCSWLCQSGCRRDGLDALPVTGELTAIVRRRRTTGRPVIAARGDNPVTGVGIVRAQQLGGDCEVGAGIEGIASVGIAVRVIA